MAIENAYIAATDTEVLVVPAGKRYAITTILVCNTELPNPIHEDHGITNFDLHFVKSGEAKSDINKVVNAMPVPAGETFTFDSEKIVLEEGDKVVMLSESPTVLSATVGYLEV